MNIQPLRAPVVAPNRAAARAARHPMRRYRPDAGGAMSEAIAAAKARITLAELELYNAKQALVKAVSDNAGVHIGDVVIYRGEEFRITKIETWMAGNKPWLRGVKRIKSGAWGEQQKTLYSDWEKSA